MLTAIDHVILPAKSLDAAARPFEHLGLTVSPRAAHGSAGTANRAFFAGREETHFYVELLTVEDEEAAREAGDREYLLAALTESPGLARVMFETDDLKGMAALAGREPYRVYREDGSTICDVVALPEGLGFPAAAISYAVPRAERYRLRAERGMFVTEFPLKRLDHLAVIAPDLDGMTRQWEEVLGVPVHGEIVTPAVVIRQMKVGDAIIELLGQAPVSPFASRAPGLVSMVAFEVEGLQAAVATARRRGFGVTDPEEGVIPGTRRATISGDQLSGLSMQLLEYVEAD